MGHLVPNSNGGCTILYGEGLFQYALMEDFSVIL